ncbi:MAG TPA: NYN domain-containing protein [Acetivibrio sp.]|uniref:NYN domain-containing protein n=1 Tax=Acetivibrio sp. TaxID=1872092 RepID=UPI002D045340|nr:NYN domain-containing protein [Acetivibrio sp.]HOM03753.1 NYN domain-containing protein [Acetivibrio sp.]
MNERVIKEIQNTIKAQNVKNVAIFVDFDNIYYGMKDYGINCEDVNYCIFTLLNKLYPKDMIRTMRAYADFDQVKVSLKLLQSKRVQIRNVYGNGKEEEHRKNASDIELSIDAIETYYKDNNIDTYVFLTSDSDMIPIMSRMLYKGKLVHLFYLNGHTTQYQNIGEYCHLSYDLIEIFEIDINRSKPEYWKDAALTEIDNWYKIKAGSNKLLGGKWLNELFCEKLMLSRKLSSALIDYLIANNFIEEKTNDTGAKGYIIK